MHDSQAQQSENGGMPAQPEVLVVDDDLLFTVRIETTLQKLGYAVSVAGDTEKALGHAAQHRLALVIINFGSKRFAPGEVVEKLKALPHPAPVLGFVSHKWIPQVRPNAMAAGCDLLVANSALSMRLPQLVARLAPRDGKNANIGEAAQIAEDADETEA